MAQFFSTLDRGQEQYDPLARGQPLVFSPEARAVLDNLWPREGRAGDPLCPCCGEFISPEGLAMLSGT